MGVSLFLIFILYCAPLISNAAVLPQQYKLFGKAPCHLTKERVDALEEMGFDWKGLVTTDKDEKEGTKEKQEDDEVAL